jgi:predicted DNA-binding transcriptional regulator YafY
VQAWLGDDAARSALMKLDQVLPATLRRRAAATDLATEVLDDAAPPTRAADIGTIADAVADAGRVRFRYLDQRGRLSTRLVDPHRHVLRGRNWYLVGYDVDRDDWRTFRFDRVSAIERVPGTYQLREFPQNSMRRWFGSNFGRLPSA